MEEYIIFYHKSNIHRGSVTNREIMGPFVVYICISQH